MAGNPCRYFFDNQVIRKPEFDVGKKELKISGWDLKEFKDFYETAVIDFYSAPDVIMTYTNGNNCKDEWRRYTRHTLKNLKKSKVEAGYCDDEVIFHFTYEDLKNEWFNYNDPIQETNIPLGKFYNMTYEQVQEYKKQNTYGYEIKKEK